MDNNSGISASVQFSNGDDHDQDLVDSSSSPSTFFNPSPNISSLQHHHWILTPQSSTSFYPYNNLTHNLDHHLTWPMATKSQLPNLTITSKNSKTPPSPSPSVLDPSASCPHRHSPHAPTRHKIKKRSRASLRASTTLLKTDTTNFKQMVQEITGFPGPPHPGPGVMFPSGDMMGPDPVYPIGPMAHRALSPFSWSTPPFPGLPRSTMVDSIVDTTNVVSTNDADDPCNDPDMARENLTEQAGDDGNLRKPFN